MACAARPRDRHGLEQGKAGLNSSWRTGGWDVPTALLLIGGLCHRVPCAFWAEIWCNAAAHSIHVGAAVDPKDLPQLESQLKPGGRLVAPVGTSTQRLMLVWMARWLTRVTPHPQPCCAAKGGPASRWHFCAPRFNGRALRSTDICEGTAEHALRNASLPSWCCCYHTPTLPAALTRFRHFPKPNCLHGM
jgi:hypothetical protein